MNVHFAIGIMISFLVPACDKPHPSRESKSTDQSGPLVTRVDRTRRDHPPSQYQQFRDSLSKAKSIQSPEARDKALAELAWSSFESDQGLFLKAFQELSVDCADRSSLIQVYASKLAQENPGEALEWAAALGTQQETLEARAQIIQVLADHDPGRAARLLGRPQAADGEIAGITMHVLHRWTAEKPLDAASWIITFQAGDARKAAIRTVISDWAQTDSQAALGWIVGLNNPTIRVEASQAIVETLIAQPRETREEWLEQADPKLRSELERQIGQMPEEAEEGMPLPSE